MNAPAAVSCPRCVARAALAAVDVARATNRSAHETTGIALRHLKAIAGEATPLCDQCAKKIEPRCKHCRTAFSDATAAYLECALEKMSDERLDPVHRVRSGREWIGDALAASRGFCSRACARAGASGVEAKTMPPSSRMKLAPVGAHLDLRQRRAPWET